MCHTTMGNILNEIKTKLFVLYVYFQHQTKLSHFVALMSDALLAMSLGTS